MIPSHPGLLRIFIMKWCHFCQMLFYIYVGDYVVLSFLFTWCVALSELGSEANLAFWRSRGPGLCPVGSVLATNSVSLHSVCLIIFSVSLWINFDDLSSWALSISSQLPNVLVCSGPLSSGIVLKSISVRLTISSLLLVLVI